MRFYGIANALSALTLDHIHMTTIADKIIPSVVAKLANMARSSLDSRSRLLMLAPPSYVQSPLYGLG